LPASSWSSKTHIARIVGTVGLNLLLFRSIAVLTLHADVTSTLTTLIIDGIASHGAHLDAFVIIHAALVGALHRLIGVEFAAHFVQTAVERYDVAYTAAKSPDAASTEENNKQCANLLALISELYTLQVVACVLPYDIVRSLLDGPLDELDVELLLKLLRGACCFAE